jgi:hypothetical protein
MQITELVGRHLGEWVAAGDGGVKGFQALKLLTFEFIVGVSDGLHLLGVLLVAGSPHPGQKGGLVWQERKCERAT